MLRITWLFLGLMVTLSAQAKLSCDHIPKVDIKTSAVSSEITQNGKTVVINADNSLLVQGQTKAVSAKTQQQAAQLRLLINTTLPWISQSVQQQLNKSYHSLDDTITEKLGKQSQLHQPLSTLNTELVTQIQQVISKQQDAWVYRYSALEKISSQNEKLITDTLASLIQSSLQDISQAGNSQTNSLLSMLNSVSELQNALQQVIKTQKSQLEDLGTTICRRATAVETARRQLYKSLDL